MRDFIILMLVVLQTLYTCSCSVDDAQLNGKVQPAEYQETIHEEYVLCAKGKTAAVVRRQLSDNAINYALMQADEQCEVNLTYSDDTGIIISDSSQQELQQIECEVYPDDPAAPIQFLDFNQDGYADIALTLGGTLNSQKAVYLWDSDSSQFVEVLYDGFLSYFEIHEDYIKNWVNDSETHIIVQILVWSGPHTLSLESETILDVETGEVVD